MHESLKNKGLPSGQYLRISWAISIANLFLFDCVPPYSSVRKLLVAIKKNELGNHEQRERRGHQIPLNDTV